jgi:shikimate dehydrogenase
MDGAPAPHLPFHKMKSDGLVTDIVYVPLMTPFLLQAKEAGLATVDGLGMLLHQAAPGFEKWFGKKPEVTQELRQIVLDDIEAHT